MLLSLIRLFHHANSVRKLYDTPCRGFPIKLWLLYVAPVSPHTGARLRTRLLSRMTAVEALLRVRMKRVRTRRSSDASGDGIASRAAARNLSSAYAQTPFSGRDLEEEKKALRDEIEHGGKCWLRMV